MRRKCRPTNYSSFKFIICSFKCESLFNLKLVGNGLAILECPVPREELVEITLKNDKIKIDDNYAVAWSSSLEFTVGKSTKTLLGSATSGESFVNVYIVQVKY